ncbi:MAG: methionyl-tRNA formyltransferase [Deltaproteobacteria bacterium]|nr:methionyl-tRNA formyltransferase [Deltaproteobacteria bacterium]
MTCPFTTIFMGTPDFAVPALKALVDYGCRIPLVVTQPDRPAGRGKKPAAPAVKIAAEKLGLSVIQPESVASDEFYQTLKKLAPDLFVVVAYGHILSKKILEIPAICPINIHASLLPRYRGPAPIQWAIIKGEKQTGVTSMLMDKGLDTGEILLSEKTLISTDDTAESLHDRLARLGAGVLTKTLAGLENKSIRPIAQNHAQASYAPMLKKKNGHINWRLSAESIQRLVRGLYPWPGTFFFLNNRRFKIFNAAVRKMEQPGPPATVIPSPLSELRVSCGKDALAILELQGASGRRMKACDFLAGNPVKPGTVVS